MLKTFAQTAVLGLTVATLAASAQFTSITSRAAMNANDTLTWNQLGPCQTTPANPAVATSALGTQVQVSVPNGNAKIYVDKTCGWVANFATGDALFAVNPGPVTLTFTPPVVAAGAQVVSGLGIGTFTGTLTAYRGDTVLGVLNGTGSNYVAENTAAFWGVSDPGGITKVVFDMDTCVLSLGGSPVPCDLVLLNQLSLVSSVKVSIDVKPGSDKNVLVADSNAKLPVAILSAPGFDATTAIDLTSLTFGRTGDEASILGCVAGEDVNADLLPDVTCQFSVQAGAFQAGDLTAKLKGKLTSGVPLYGSGNILAK